MMTVPMRNNLEQIYYDTAESLMLDMNPES